MKLFIIVNEDRFFLSHRKDIAVAAQKTGWDVTIVCKDTGQRKDIEIIGLKMLDLPINPTGLNLKQELKTFKYLYWLYIKNKDAVVHHVGLKNILWGGLAAKLARVRGVVNAVSGLGTLFNGEHPSMIARAVMRVMRFSNHRRNVVTIFQNHDDEKLFYKFKVTTPDQSVYIKGSGVNLNDFNFSPVV